MRHWWIVNDQFNSYRLGRACRVPTFYPAFSASLRFIFFNLLVVIFIRVVPVFAQEAEIGVNDSAIVTVSADAPAVLIFANESAGQAITITAYAMDVARFDPVVWVLNDAGLLLAYNDNAAEPEAAITNLVLPATGLYRIIVDSFNGVSAGDVEVAITAGDIFDATTTQEGDSTIVRFSLPEDSVFSYPLTPSGGDSFTITAHDKSGTLDPYLRIVDSAGNVVAKNDDHNSADLSLNLLAARVVNWQVPTADNYSIEVFDFLGRVGDIVLEIQPNP